MIYRLEIENFYSVHERQVIDLTVGKNVPEEPGRLVSIHDGAEVRAPRVAAIFGANASGKSNVLRAIAFLSWFVQSSFDFEAKGLLPYAKFATRKASNAPTRLSVTFTGPEDPMNSSTEASQSCPYVYTLELSSRIYQEDPAHGERLHYTVPETEPPRVVRDSVLRESLHYRPAGTSRLTRIIERNASGSVKAARWVGSGRDLSVLENILRPNASVIATLAQLNNRPAQNLMQLASAVVSNILVIPIEHNDHGLAGLYDGDSTVLNALNQEIRRADLGINRVRISKETGVPIAIFDHTGLETPIAMPLESRGTQQFFRIFPMIHIALASGGIAVVDELDTAIHPSLLPEILRWFSDPNRNPHGAQLWMSCHTVSLLDELHKEEVLFCEKKSTVGATEIYRLADIKGTRRNENFMRSYLGGIFGGLPSIG